MEQIKLFNMRSFEFQDSYILASHKQIVACQLVASKDGAIAKPNESTLSSKKWKVFVFELEGGTSIPNHESPKVGMDTNDIIMCTSYVEEV
jgi:hypothetical protein